MTRIFSRRSSGIWPIWRGHDSLGAKLVTILTAAGVAGALATTLLLAMVITPSFNRLEVGTIQSDIQRTRAILSDFGAGAENAARDYGDWDTTYASMARPTAAFQQNGVSPLAMATLGVQGMAYVDAQGRVVASRWLDATSQAERPAMRRRFALAIGAADLPRALNGRGSGNFYVRLGREVAAIGVARVRRSDGSGSARGHVVMARVLTSGQIAGLLRLGATIGPATTAADEILTRDRAQNDVRVPIAGLDDRPIASVRFVVRREVSLLGRRMLLLAVAGSTILLLIVLMVLRRMIEREVLAPLHRVESHMQRVRASGSLSPLDEDGRQDEIGALGRSFNAMLRQLNDLREQIEIQSFALGRSDSAVAVMHNVRNALNPVSTILSQGIAQPPPVDRAMIDRALAELTQDDTPAARRRRLAAFVAAGTEAWTQGHDAERAALAVARDAMAHALEIIGQQQQHAHERPPLEVCDLAEALARNATIARHSDLAAIDFSFPATTTQVLANRVILSQVIGNLFGNAAESIAARGAGGGTIAVSVEERAGLVEIRISDDGAGFDAATGMSLFQRGYSTRRHKSGGLGLHWCANSMVAMDGSLRLESAGMGQGAVAILTLRAADRLAAAA